MTEKTAEGLNRQRGTYLHEWTCDCGHKCSRGREPKSLGKIVATWCYGCRKMKRVQVPETLGGYIPGRQVVERDRISDLEAALTEREERIAAQAKEIEALKQANASLAADIAKHASAAMRTVRP